MFIIYNMFICTNCDAQYNKWQGNCPQCEKWGTLIDTSKSNEANDNIAATSLKNIKTDKNLSYLKTNFNEFNNVLGGGIMKGSLVLLGGEPGIGKSTISLQIAHNIKNKKVLYCAGEESVQQLKIRADRLKIDNPDILIISETDIEKICAYSIKEKIDFLIIDSIHTAYSSQHTAEAGSVTQIRLVAQTILNKLKNLNITTLLIGQITKDGSIAGPKTLEHLVDTVIYMEKEHDFRIARVTKNRFGSTNKICIFKMLANGLNQVNNFNNQLLSHMHIDSPPPGTTFSLINDNNKNIITEIQALVNKTVFGYPQRKTVGYDNNKLQILCAVINKFTKINLSSYDIHINLASGLRTKDPGIDLAVAMAIISSFLDISIPPKSILFGEIGLAGTIKPPKNLKDKITEATQLGFTTIISNSSINVKDVKIIKINRINDIAKILNF